MQEKLYIRLPASSTSAASSPVPWFIWHSQQQQVIASGQLSSPEQLDELQQQARRCVTTLLLPGQDVLLKQVELPAGTRRHLERVIPYALEDELASDIETLHFSWPQSIGKSTSAVPVAVIAHERMQQWQQWLSEAQIEADHWCPETLLLPYQPGHWSALLAGDAVIIRTAPWQGLTIEHSQLEAVGPLLAAESGQPETIRHYGELNWDNPPAPLQSADIEQPLSAFALSEPVLDVRRGRYAVKSRQQSQLNWKPLAIAAGVAFVVAVGANLLRGYQLNNQAEQLKAQAEQQYRQAFPDQTRIVNLRVQLQRQLQAAGASDEQQQSVLALLQTLQPVFSQQQGMRLELMRYQDGELRLQALANNFSQFEQFQRLARQAGLQVEQGALNNRGNQVAGSITVAAGGRS
ncbi:type II secretion system protein GspL [Idiomarina seosinensis]|uniref:type II secretion system protein GspL n=1 Tax=Idiomarina seosinensis TaxID=281739 RepID=UPI003851698A